MMTHLYIYLILINAVGFVIMLTDKYKAKTRSPRIPETTLLTVAAIGGSLGCLMGMYTVRHKTRQPKFTLGIPALLLLHAIVLHFLQK